MEIDTYVKLERAIKNNELGRYLVSDYRYRTFSEPGIDVMNDFYDICCNLNEYGSLHPGFDKTLHDLMMQILDDNKIFYTYSIANIINEQIDLEARKKSKIHFVDEQLLQKLKSSIISNSVELKNIRDYEGALDDNGLYGVYEEFDKNIYGKTGHHIM